MADVVQIKCPACQHILRIPADWTDQAVRCKRCQQVFQARRKDAVPVSGNATSPAGVRPRAPAKAPPAPPPAHVKTAPRPVREERAGGSGGFGVVKALLLGGVILAGVGAAAVVLLIVLGSHISKLFESGPAQQQVQITLKNETTAGPGTPRDTAKHPGGDPKQGKGDPVGGNPNRRDPKKKVEDPKNTKDPGHPSGQHVAGVTYPRRALLISVCEYPINPLPYGKPPQGDQAGSSPHALAVGLEDNLDFPKNQVAELSDKAEKPVPPKKATIEDTIADFLATSRSQDCILLLFSGHAVEIDKEAYLVPIDGRPGDPKTLISFTWLYTQLGKCKAHQKVLVLDIGRGGPVGDVLYGHLQKPPDNVRVWTSCLAKEQALPTTDGSLFLEALCGACRDKSMLTRPDEPIPVKAIAEKADRYVQEKAKAKNHKQTTALLGKDRPGSVPFKAEEKEPPAVAIKVPVEPVGPKPHVAELKAMLDEMAGIPQSTRDKLTPLNPANLDFPAAMFQEYKADYKDLMEFKEKREGFPLRATVAEAVLALRKNAAMPMRAMMDDKKGKELDVLKQQITAEQKNIGAEVFALKEALDAMLDAHDLRKKESKRWQVLYDLVLLRLKSRIVYVADYNFILGQFRGGAFSLAEGDKLFRLTSQEALSTNDSFYRDLGKEVKKGWDNLPKDYRDTPWAIQAQRESTIHLGLTWKSVKN
jgi:hypothetical protein